MVHVLILACRRQREVGFCEFHAGQGYTVRSCFVLFSYEGMQLSKVYCFFCFDTVLENLKL